MLLFIIANFIMNPTYYVQLITYNQAYVANGGPPGTVISFGAIL